MKKTKTRGLSIIALTVVLVVVIAAFVGCGKSDAPTTTFVPSVEVIEWDTSRDFKTPADVNFMRGTLNIIEFRIYMRNPKNSRSQEIEGYTYEVRKDGCVYCNGNNVAEAHETVKMAGEEVITNNSSEKLVYSSEEAKLASWSFAERELYSFPKGTVYVGVSEDFGYIFHTEKGELISVLPAEPDEDGYSATRYTAVVVDKNVDIVLDTQYQASDGLAGPLVKDGSKVFVLTPTTSEEGGFIAARNKVDKSVLKAYQP